MADKTNMTITVPAKGVGSLQRMITEKEIRNISHLLLVLFFTRVSQTSTLTLMDFQFH